MASFINVRSNIPQVIQTLDHYRAEVVNAATVGALNKVATTARAQAVTEIRKTYNVKQGAARGQIDIKRASKNRLYADIVASGKRLSLLSFTGTRQNKQGVSVKIKVQGGRKTIAHAFIQTTKRGQQGAFRRKGKSRYPLEFLTSVGVQQQFASRVINDALVKTIKEKFPQVFRQELSFRSSK